MIGARTLPAKLPEPASLDDAFGVAATRFGRRRRGEPSDELDGQDTSSAANHAAGVVPTTDSEPDERNG